MIRFLYTFAICVLLAIPVHATDGVPAAYRLIAAEYSLPPMLLYSIAITESGIRKHNYRNRQPWPWTVNHAGKGIYFDTRQEAYDYLSQVLRKGQKNFDVGLMQVNWHWNRHVFDSSLWNALDPYTNLRGGASIIRTQYHRLGSFEKAVGAYHSPGNIARANAYRERVRDNLAIILQANTPQSGRRRF
ncbi:MAG: transglycosylase SLT domain-containing protein [Gammaproteobacteria bacterium]|nr:transglycosylase SLT domain-containing protein [Gammaproteobacteria bacterium]